MSAAVRLEQAKRVHRRFPGQRGWVWCWDTTPWGGGHVVDRGAVGGVRLPDGSLLYLDTGRVLVMDFKEVMS